MSPLTDEERDQSHPMTSSESQGRFTALQERELGPGSSAGLDSARAEASPPMSPQDQAAKDKALQSMAAMSSAQIISAAAFHSKMTLTRGPGYPAVSGVSGAACSQRPDHPVLLLPPPSEETQRWPHQSPHLSLLREGGTKD